METTLPVWTIRPNWKGGILERLEWLTDVLTSDTGVEQRRSVRPSPRRSIEITVNPTNQDRAFLDLILHKLGGETWLFPLWFDKGRLSASVAATETRVPCDNTYREFLDGGLALIYQDTFTWEVISIESQDDTGLNLDVPLDNAWGKGAAVYPLRRALMQVETKLDALTSRVGESVILFQVAEANEYPEVMPADNFGGMPVLTTAPNRKQTITTDQIRSFDQRDGQVGLVYRRDKVGRGFEAQAHNWTIVGRQAQSEFRSMLYWLRGKQRALWLPTFNDDVELSQNSVVGANVLTIKKIGMGYVGGVVPGRDRIRIAGQVASLSSMGIAPTPEEERLNLSAPMGAAIPKGRCGSFLDAARLDSDTLELHHHADTNGAMECGVTFRTFSNIRTTAGPIYTPIPAAAKSNIPCGSPEGDSNPCDVYFPGWYWQVVFRLGMSGGNSPYMFGTQFNEGGDAYYGDNANIVSEESIPWQHTYYLGEDYPDGFVCSTLQQLDNANLFDGPPVMTEPVDVGDGVFRPMFHVITKYWTTSAVDQPLGAQTRLPTPWVFNLIKGD